MKKPRNYETHNFHQVLEHHGKDRTYLNAHGWGESPAPLAFSGTKIQNNMEEKKKRGAKREGAGRKHTTVKPYIFYATQEVHDILSGVENSRSAYICQCIVMAAQMMQNAKKG